MGVRVCYDRLVGCQKFESETKVCGLPFGTLMTSEEVAGWVAGLPFFVTDRWSTLTNTYDESDHLDHCHQIQPYQQFISEGGSVWLPQPKGKAGRVRVQQQSPPHPPLLPQKRRAAFYPSFIGTPTRATNITKCLSTYILQTMRNQQRHPLLQHRQSPLRCRHPPSLPGAAAVRASTSISAIHATCSRS